MPSFPAPSGAPAVLHAVGFAGPWPALLSELAPAAEPGRVVRDGRGRALLITAHGELSVRVPADLPVVTGDWVAFAGGAVVAVAPRATCLSRPREAGGRQVLAANVDVVAVVCPLDRPLHRRRLERGLVLAWESGARPLVLLTKADLVADVSGTIAAAAASAPGVDVVAVSVADGRGLDDLRAVVAPHDTLVLLGASGAGKSSVVNALVGEQRLAVGAVRDKDGKGRHTTTQRELVALPSGGCLIDTPGLRALAIGTSAAGVDLAFADLEGLSSDCRFTDCSHEREPGCAVLAAVASGALRDDRYEGWRRLRREVANAELRADVARWRRQNRQWGRRGREAQRAKRDGGGS